MSATSAGLDHSAFELLAGSDLQNRVGFTIELVATDPDGWPRLALISVGEVVAQSPVDLRLALHAGSGTCEALRRSKKALLSFVHLGTHYKIRVEIDLVDNDSADPLVYFRGRVTDVQSDRSDYAQLVSGTTYTLINEPEALSRWERQLTHMRTLEP